MNNCPHFINVCVCVLASRREYCSFQTYLNFSVTLDSPRSNGILIKSLINVYVDKQTHKFLLDRFLCSTEGLWFVDHKLTMGLINQQTYLYREICVWQGGVHLSFLCADQHWWSGRGRGHCDFTPKNFLKGYMHISFQEVWRSLGQQRRGDNFSFRVTEERRMEGKSGGDIFVHLGHTNSDMV